MKHYSDKGGGRALKILRSLALCAVMITGIFTHSATEVNATASTVTIKLGEIEWYAPGDEGGTTVKWVTHIDGEPVDLDDVPGIKRSYAYCVQPTLATPSSGTYNVVVVDDDDTGTIAKMRKLVYYLPGAYGYTKVTKKRWFSNNNTGATDYSLGHIALSYVYSKTDAWNGGVGDKIKSKVKSMLNDLDNLKDPPEDFEVFWIKKNGYQDVFGAFYKTEYGKAAVKKEDALTTISKENPNYTLEGAEYTIYEDSSCTQAVKGSSGSATLIRTKADGSSDAVEIETGIYYVKETKAAKGYAMDEKVYPIEIVKDKTSIVVSKEIPKSNAVSLLIQKTDAETGLPKPQGAASLADAEYSIKFYAVKVKGGMSQEEMAEAVKSKSPAKIGGAEAVWLFKTDEAGEIDLSRPEEYLIKDKSADYFYNSSGEVSFPIGIISVEETKAPEGYLLDKTIRYAAISDEGGAEKLNTLICFTEENSLKEQVIRGDLSLNKSAEGRRRMAGVPFSFTSMTTGEVHVLVTDKNGHLSTASSWNSHDTATNEGSSDKDGIWFNGYNDESSGAKVNNELGALPYDSYLMEEVRCDANKGFELFSDEISIERHATTIHLGTYDDAKEDEPVPVLKKEPPEEDEPSEPSEPSEPKEPDEPNEPKEPGSPGRPQSPKTGDGMSMDILYCLAAIAVSLEALLLTAKRRNDRLN